MRSLGNGGIVHDVMAAPVGSTVSATDRPGLRRDRWIAGILVAVLLVVGGGYAAWWNVAAHDQPLGTPGLNPVDIGSANMKLLSDGVSQTGDCQVG